MTKKMLAVALMAGSALVLAGCNNTPAEPVTPDTEVVVEEVVTPEAEVVVEEVATGDVVAPEVVAEETVAVEPVVVEQPVEIVAVE